ncbi:MAG: hypothetical protein ACYS8X_14215 [Planctomycetota bacterium]
MSRPKDVAVLRQLAFQYVEAAADPHYDELRQLWRDGRCSACGPMAARAKCPR